MLLPLAWLLLPLACDVFAGHERIEVSIGKTPYARFDLNDYSVPYTHVRRTLTVIADTERVRLLEGSAVHHVNLIPWNEVDGLRFAASRGDRAQAFFERLRAAGRAVHLRRARGADQDAACGQLAKRAT